MAYTIKEAVHVDIVIDGKSESFDFAPGDTDLPAAVLPVLEAQGLVIEAAAKKAAKPTPEETLEA